MTLLNQIIVTDAVLGLALFMPSSMAQVSQLLSHELLASHCQVTSDRLHKLVMNSSSKALVKCKLLWRWVCWPQRLVWNRYILAF